VPFWSRTRIALVAASALCALAMLYVGLFQVGYSSGLACPLFGAGCESVALAPLAWPLGFSDGLLYAALFGFVCALAQVRRRDAAPAVVGLAFVAVLALLIDVFAMQRFHAWCFWHLAAALLSLPIAALAVRCGRAATVAPDHRAEQQQ
jgi:hypothetical protein